MSSNNNNKNENITFFLDDSELETSDPFQIDLDCTKEIFINLEENTCNNKINDSYHYFLNYQLNYTVKQLLLICDYYGIQNKNKKKDEIINELVFFETNPENMEIVCKRQNMWFYANELKNDKFMKKYVLW
jgi:hypothetical protein